MIQTKKKVRKFQLPTQKTEFKPVILTGVRLVIQLYRKIQTVFSKFYANHKGYMSVILIRCRITISYECSSPIAAHFFLLTKARNVALLQIIFANLKYT